MEIKKKGKEIPIEDGHPASYRNADGTIKNIYDGDGNLTEEGKKVMLLRENLSKESYYEEMTDKERKRKRKLIIWSISVIAIVFFLLFFHVYISSDRGFKVFAKSTPTFAHTFITEPEVNAVLKRYNNASIFERMAIQNEPFFKILMEKGIINNSKAEIANKAANEQQKQELPDVETFKYYYDGLTQNHEWRYLEVTFYYGKNEIKTVTSMRTITYIIVGNPKYEDGCTTYYVHYSDDRNKKILQIKRCKDETRKIYDRGVPDDYEIYRKDIDKIE